MVFIVFEFCVFIVMDGLVSVVLIVWSNCSLLMLD